MSRIIEILKRHGIDKGLFSQKVFFLCLWGAVFLISGCASMPPEPVAVSRPAPAPVSPGTEQIPSEVTPAPKKPGPRTLASLRLTDRARMLLEKGRPDEAIRELERAVNLAPDNGRNYYYLAEAWLMKGNRGQAREFNRLAGIYLEKDAEWYPKVKGQKARIEKSF